MVACMPTLLVRNEGEFRDKVVKPWLKKHNYQCDRIENNAASGISDMLVMSATIPRVFFLELKWCESKNLLNLERVWNLLEPSQRIFIEKYRRGIPIVVLVGQSSELATSVTYDRTETYRNRLEFFVDSPLKVWQV